MFNRTSEIGQRFKRILIEGQPGCGKSTLMDKIAYDWATNKDPNSPLAEIDLLFYLKMRWFDPDTTIEDAIIKQLLAQDDTINPEELLTFITNISTSATIGIILDGYDECNHIQLSQTGGTATNITSILQNSTLKNCVVVVTTRPEKSHEFGKYFDDYQVFEVAGFTKENMKAYVEKFLNDDKEASELLQFLENIGLRHELASMPLLIHLMCLYWEKERKTKRKDLNQQSTVYEIYQEIHGFIIQHYLDRIGVSGRELATKGEEVTKLISKLGELALHGLLHPHRKVVWTREDLQSYLDDSEIKQACEIGIIVQDERNDEHDENESTTSFGFHSSLKKVTCFEFFHKTSQEIHAGKYLGCCSTDIVKSYLEKHANTVNDALELQMLFLFACGENTTVAQVIVTHLCTLFLRELLSDVDQYYRGELDFETTRKFQLFYDLCLQCNFESKGKDKFIDTLLRLFPEHKMVFYGMQFQTAKAIKYLLNNMTDRRCISTLKVVGLPRRGRVISITESANTLVDKEYKYLREKVGRKPLKEIQDLLRSESILQHIAKEGGETKAIVNEQLWQKFENWQGGSEFIPPLVDGIANADLSTLNLRQVVIGHQSATLFRRIKEGSFTKLTELNLRDTGLCDEDLLLFVDCIDNLQMLESLDISYNNIGISLVELSTKLKQHLQHGGSLRKLDIRDSHIPSEVMTSFWKNFASFGQQFEDIYAHGASNITSNDGVHSLVGSIPNFPNLRGVSFSGTEVTRGIHISNFFSAISETPVWNIAMYEVALPAEDFINILRQGLVSCLNLKWVMLGCKHNEQQQAVTMEIFKGFLEVLRGLKSVTRFGLKDVPLNVECLKLLLDLAESNNYEELM